MTEIPGNEMDAVEEIAEGTPKAEGEGKEYSGRKIMCYVSKRMVAFEDTVEVEYAAGKKYRVLPQYVK
jgi:hypothetical protein